MTPKEYQPVRVRIPEPDPRPRYLDIPASIPKEGLFVHFQPSDRTNRIALSRITLWEGAHITYYLYPHKVIAWYKAFVFNVPTSDGTQVPDRPTIRFVTPRSTSDALPLDTKLGMWWLHTYSKSVGWARYNPFEKTVTIVNTLHSIPVGIRVRPNHACSMDVRDQDSGDRFTFTIRDQSAFRTRSAASPFASIAFPSTGQEHMLTPDYPAWQWRQHESVLCTFTYLTPHRGIARLDKEKERQLSGSGQGHA